MGYVASLLLEAGLRKTCEALVRMNVTAVAMG